MYIFSVGVALLAAVAIIAIGLMYLFAPRAATASFGLPLPEPGLNVAWWLRLKGVRDVVSGLIVLAALAWGDPRVLGAAVLIEALVPLGDMSLVLASQGSRVRAFGVHGATAALMIVAGLALFTGAA
jgi:hypothetical protein